MQLTFPVAERPLTLLDELGTSRCARSLQDIATSENVRKGGAPHASPFWMKQVLTRPLTQKISCNPPAVQLLLAGRLMLRGGCLAASKVLAAV